MYLIDLSLKYCINKCVFCRIPVDIEKINVDICVFKTRKKKILINLKLDIFILSKYVDQNNIYYFFEKRKSMVHC